MFDHILLNFRLNDANSSVQSTTRRMRLPHCYCCIGLHLFLIISTSALSTSLPGYNKNKESPGYSNYYNSEYYYDPLAKVKHTYYSQTDPCPTLGVTISTADECARAAVLLELIPSKIEPNLGQLYGCYWEHTTGERLRN